MKIWKKKFLRRIESASNDLSRGGGGTAGAHRDALSFDESALRPTMKGRVRPRPRRAQGGTTQGALNYDKDAWMKKD